jgi:hypothetical protein
MQAERLYELVVESSRLHAEAGRLLEQFDRVSTMQVSADDDPVAQANKLAAELLRILPEIEIMID